MKKIVKMIAMVLLSGALLLGPAAEVLAGFDVTMQVRDLEKIYEDLLKEHGKDQ